MWETIFTFVVVLGLMWAAVYYIVWGGPEKDA